MVRNRRQKGKRCNLLSDQEDRNIGMPPTAFLTTLPDEVLADIFLWAIALADGRAGKHEAPVNLSQTCRSLRALALSQNRFWAHINLTNTLYSDDGHFKTSNFSMCSLWLTRSRNALLDISLDLFEDLSEKAAGKSGGLDVVAMLAPSQSRWKRLVLRSRPHFCNDYDFPLADLSQLRELVIELIDEETETLTFLSRALKFPKITATQAPIATQLVHLHVHFIYTQDVMAAMLDHCPALECFNIGRGEEHALPLVHNKSDIGPGGTNNRLSRIGFDDCFHPLLFLSWSRLPALEAIDLRLAYIWTETLTAFLLSTRTGPLLRRASLEFFLGHYGRSRGSDGQRDKLYEAMPNVTHLYLTLRDNESRGGDFQSLSFEATGRGRFPELEYFKMKLPNIVAAKPLENMLASRMLHSDRFRAVIDTSEWSLQRSKAFFARERIKSWVDSGRLEVVCIR